MIVKNLLVVGVVAGFATAAAAADEKANWAVSGKVRVDATQSSVDTTKGSEPKKTAKSSSIGINRAQFNLIGTRGSDTMTMKYIADTNTLDTATITHKFSDMVSATFGRMAMLAQSWENDYSYTDQYLVSMTGLMAPSNSDGAQIDLGFGDHSLSIQALQGVSSAKGYTFDSKGGLSTSLQYRGNINNMIRPLITYTIVKAAGSAGYVDANGNASFDEGEDTINMGNGLQNQLGAGVQVSAGGATIDLEYDTITSLKAKAPTGGKDEKYTSIVAQVKYPVGSTTPFLKIASNSSKLGADKDVGDVTGMGLALGVEHALDGNCRLHAVYTNSNSTTKGDGSGKDTKETGTGFNFGVTASM